MPSGCPTGGPLIRETYCQHGRLDPAAPEMRHVHGGHVHAQTLYYRGASADPEASF